MRGATLRRALASNHPAALARLAELSDDEDERVAAAATATQVRLRDAPVPLHYRLLGPFGISRSGWDVPASAWARPMDPRLVRLLLVSGGKPVVEDVIFEALWPESAPDSARRSLQVVVSRARRVLDLPGAERSAIENLDGAYRLALSDRDRIDAEEFAPQPAPRSPRSTTSAGPCWSAPGRCGRASRCPRSATPTGPPPIASG